MSNNYYRAFTPGFNWWYLAAPAAIVLSFLIGWAIPRVERTPNGGLRLKMVANMRLGYLVSGLLTLGWGILLVSESYRGIVQTFDNSLTWQDSPVWSLLFAGGAVAILCGIMLALCVCSYRAGRNGKKKSLIRRFRLKKRTQPATPINEMTRLSRAAVVPFQAGDDRAMRS
ncbi:MAG: hypothetical protein ACK5MU_00130 [Candidatus Saccharimonadales bacterium]